MSQDLPIFIKQCPRSSCRRFCADADDRVRSCPHPNPDGDGSGTCCHPIQVVDRPDVEAAYRLRGSEILSIPGEV